MEEPAIHESAENVAEHETSDNEPENVQYNFFKTMKTRKRKLIDDSQSKSDKRKKIVTRSISKELNTLVCDICTASFTRKDNLARHRRNKH